MRRSEGTPNHPSGFTRLGDGGSTANWQTAYIRQALPGKPERKEHHMSALAPFTEVGVSKITSPQKRRKDRRDEKQDRRDDRRDKRKRRR
jgi:hypothetical protein